VRSFLSRHLHFNELWANVGGDRTEIGLELREELKRAPNNRHRKRMRTAELDLGAGPSHWIAESEDRGSAEPPSTSTKRRRITMERKTEDRVATQKGGTQELGEGPQQERRPNPSLATKDSGRRHLWHRRKEFILHSHRGRPQEQPWIPLSLRIKLGRGWGSERISEGTEDVHDEETDEKR